MNLFQQINRSTGWSRKIVFHIALKINIFLSDTCSYGAKMIPDQCISFFDYRRVYLFVWTHSPDPWNASLSTIQKMDTLYCACDQNIKRGCMPYRNPA